jgi:hypothetical protein
VVHPPLHVRYRQHRCVPSSPRCFRVWQTQECLTRRLLTASTSASTPLFDCLDASLSSSLVASPLRHRSLRASSSAHGFLCGSLPLATSIAPHRPRLPYARHHRPRQFTIQFGCTDIGTKGYHPHELLASFLSSRSICTTPTFQLRGDVSSSAFVFFFFCSLIVCGAPAVTTGDVRVYLLVADIRIVDCHRIQGSLASQALHSHIYRLRSQCNTSIQSNQSHISTAPITGRHASQSPAVARPHRRPLRAPITGRRASPSLVAALIVVNVPLGPAVAPSRGLRTPNRRPPLPVLVAGAPQDQFSLVLPARSAAMGGRHGFRAQRP